MSNKKRVDTTANCVWDSKLFWYFSGRMDASSLELWVSMPIIVFLSPYRVGTFFFLIALVKEKGFSITVSRVGGGGRSKIQFVHA